MDTNLLIALASLLSAMGAVAAALVAVFTLRAQQRMQQRQHNLDNYWRMSDTWTALRGVRRQAAHSILDRRYDDPKIADVINHLEQVAHLARTGEVRVADVQHLLGYAAVAWWHVSEPVIAQMRDEAGTTEPYEDLEWLQQQIRFQGRVTEFSHLDWVDAYVARQAENEDVPLPVTVVQARP